MPETTTTPHPDAPSAHRPGHPAWCIEDDIEDPGPRHPRYRDPSLVVLMDHDGILPSPPTSTRARRVTLTREDVLELADGGAVVATQGEDLIFVGDVSETGCLDARAARELAADLLLAADILEGLATA